MDKKTRCYNYMYKIDRDNLYNLMAREGLNYASLAEKTGMSRSTICRIFKGQRNASWDTVNKLARGLADGDARQIIDNPGNGDVDTAISFIKRNWGAWSPSDRQRLADAAILYSRD